MFFMGGSGSGSRSSHLVECLQNMHLARMCVSDATNMDQYNEFHIFDLLSSVCIQTATRIEHKKAIIISDLIKL